MFPSKWVASHLEYGLQTHLMAGLTLQAKDVFMALTEETMVRNSSEEERRRDDRFEWGPKNEISFILLDEGSPQTKESGHLINRSNGGLCIEVRKGVSDQQVIHLLIPTAQSNTTAPTLGEVRWTSRAPGETEGVRVGVKYLL